MQMIEWGFDLEARQTKGVHAWPFYLCPSEFICGKSLSWWLRKPSNYTNS